MSIPKHFVEQVRARASLYGFARTRIRFDPGRSKPERGQYWACCPFHNEKTPSFSIDDRKGVYYCFGCGAKGNTVSFVQKIANVGFPEAIRILAAQEGMEVPAATAGETKQMELEGRLIRANNLAATFFQKALIDSRGAEARHYLQEERKLSRQTVEQFGLGYAPNAKSELQSFLSANGVSLADMDQAGLVGIPDKDGDDPYDFFRHRIMFPIHAPGGDVLGFGGRALSAQARAKYLNTRDTPIFKKGQLLYWFGTASEAARQSDTLYVAEGYMDVIAMVAAGVGNTVAPLGTALRMEQLQLAWKRVAKIVVAFDGDDAGIHAATRAAELALGALSSGRELRLALLPQGVDPDDLIRDQGVGALREILVGAQSIADLIWDRESLHTNFGDPDSAAALNRRINELTEKIVDKSLRFEYRDSLRAKIRQAKQQQRWGNDRRNSKPWDQQYQQAGIALKQSPAALVKGGDRIACMECGILCALMQYRELLDEFIDDLTELQFLDAKLERVRDELVAEVLAATTADEEVMAGLQRRLDEIRKRFVLVGLLPFIGNSKDTALARQGVRELIADHRHRLQGMREVQRGIQSINDRTADRSIDESLRRWREEDWARSEATTAPEDVDDPADIRRAIEELATAVAQERTGIG